MADVVICAAPENEATARLLGEAIGREGFQVWRSDAAPDAANSDAVTEQIGAAKAALVVWSEAASASDWVRAEANVARGLKKLVQVSADGRPPPVPFDPALAISVLTWRGEADHPAWRNIRTALVALCGEPVAAAMPVPVAPIPVVAAPAPAPAPDPVVTAPAKRSGGVLAALLVLLLVAALAAAGYYWWTQRGERGPAPSLELNDVAPAPPASETAPAPQPEAEALPDAPAAPEARFDQEAVIRSASGYAYVRNTPSGIGFNIARVPAGEVFTTYAQTGDWWQVRTARGTVGYMAAADIRLRDAAAPAQPETETAAPEGERPNTAPERRAEAPRPRPTRSRIVKENSAVMSAFCENAGQGTPQCRAYQREGGR